MLQRSMLSRTVRPLLIAAALGLCLAPLQAQDAMATVLVQTGQVSVASDQRGFDVQALFQGMTIKPQQLIVTGPDGYAQFQVSDGSTFEVFSNARMVFRPTLGNWKDLLNVVLGRVKVFIKHAPGQVNRNDVSSPTAVISVRGTVFDVIVEDSEGTTLVTVDEGLVDVRNQTAAGNKVSLNPGDFVRVFRNVPLALAKPDRGNVMRIALDKARGTIWQILIQRAGGGGRVGTPGTTPGPSGDKKPGGTAPGNPPAAPGNPPAPPGGGN